MATLYQIDWGADNLAAEIIEDGTYKFDDSLWETFADSTRDLDFGPEFLDYIASMLNVKSIQKTLKLKAQGTQNTHYCLHDCNGKKYIVRLGGEGFSIEKEDQGFRIAREFQKLKLLEDLCPEAFRVHFSDESKKFVPLKYFVGDFIEGHCPGIDATNYTDEMIVDAARVAKRIHSVDREVLEQRKFPAKSFMYEPFDSIFSHFANDDGTLPGNMYHETLEATKDVLPLVLESPMGLTHGDFHYANMLMTDSGIKAVDWEMAHIGYQIVDVATFIMNGAGGFGPSEQQRYLFLREYGYGETVEERLVLWFFLLKRAILMVYVMQILESSGDVLEQFSRMGIGILTDLLGNKPK